eukprot:6340308-Amphidinium_carterae.1
MTSMQNDAQHEHGDFHRTCRHLPRSCQFCLRPETVVHHHYMKQEGDVGIGCVYRSVQMMLSYRNIEIPTIRQLADYYIQTTSEGNPEESIPLISLGGAAQLLSRFGEQHSTIKSFATAQQARTDLKDHFRSHGDPVIVTLGRSAYVLVGVYTDPSELLSVRCLDPHIEHDRSPTFGMHYDFVVNSDNLMFVLFPASARTITCSSSPPTCGAPKIDNPPEPEPDDIVPERVPPASLVAKFVGGRTSYYQAVWRNNTWATVRDELNRDVRRNKATWTIRYKNELVDMAQLAPIHEADQNGQLYADLVRVPPHDSRLGRS